MRVVGLDPGVATGALAVLDNTDVLLLAELPVYRVHSAHRKALRAELDLHGVYELLTQHTPYSHAYVERVGPMPKQGLTSTWRFGMAYGAILGVLTSMGVPLSLISPQSWQRFHGCGPSPDSARQRACMLYPAVAPQLARKCDTHKADALLIAAFGLAR